jgi:cytochrome c-type biogenesis protein CcmE
MKKYSKFAALITVVVGTMVWLAVTGGKQSQAYYKTVDELSQMGQKAFEQRVRVGGDVVAGSIHHVGNQTQFTLVCAAMDGGSCKEKGTVQVVYTGTDPLPDTLKDGSQALADGRLGRDHIFRAATVQAKCASKYEAKPGLAPGQAAPNVNTGKSSI